MLSSFCTEVDGEQHAQNHKGAGKGELTPSFSCGYKSKSLGQTNWAMNGPALSDESRPLIIEGSQLRNE
ncbi:hypothetical protein VNO78_26585 [Psophocarpus tetragonolobus]|uniref:Uncharacterized protein n=1 Tax=Psophocarpus tetragonolobus TaxID=3891 RepID=A0AAN9X9X4_PSOTE